MIKRGCRSMKPYPWYNKHYNRKIRGFFFVNVQQNNSQYLWYNEWKDIWVDSPRKATCSGATLRYCWSVKALIRKIKSWNLPNGSIVKAGGKYKGEDWVFKVTS